MVTCTPFFTDLQVIFGAAVFLDGVAHFPILVLFAPESYVLAGSFPSNMDSIS